MKNYFGFNLTGKKLFPVWFLFLVFFIVPYGAIIFMTKDIHSGEKPSLLILPLMLLLIIIAFVFTFYLTKLAIENITYKDKAIVFEGTFGKFMGKILLGFLLTMITLGIYGAWFAKDMIRYFTNNSFYNAENFEFKGKGGKLFIILLLTLILPLILVSIILVAFMAGHKDQDSSKVIMFQLIFLVILIPYIYSVYKWSANVNYKDFHISWETNFWNSCGKLAIEILLSVITIGIYSPLAVIRLYKYFAERTVAVGNEKKLTFGYDIDPLNDFLFIWGQILLTIITLSIYYPWAYCKVRSRILGKTYLEQN